MSKATKTLSVRLPEEQASVVETIAHAEGVTVSETIRAALNRYITKCRTDPEFKKRVKQRMEKDREILESFTE